MQWISTLGRRPPTPTARARPLRRLVVALAVLAAAAGFVSRDAPPVHAARTWYVSTTGDDAANGHASQPLRTISAAVARARSGDVIEVRGGTYRESVQVYRKAIHIRSRAGERVVLDGSRPVGGWRRSGDRWYVDGWTTQFAPDLGARVPDDHPVAGFPDQVFVDDAALEQVLSVAAVRPGTFFHDTAGDRVWIGDDPSGRSVRISDRSWAIYLNGADGSRLTDLTVRRYATERRHIAAIRAYANDLVLDGVVADENAAIGISVIGDRVTIRNGRAADNGYLGMHADRAAGLTVDRMSIVGNNRAGFDPFHSAGGLKVTTSTGVVVRGSDVSFNAGPGIWTDISSSDATIVGNTARNNLRSGIEVELTDGAVVAGNAATANGEAGIWILESTDADVWNNTAIDNGWQIKVEEGPRRDVRAVDIGNNVLGVRTSDGRALLDVNDWTEQRSASRMGVTADHNVFRVLAGEPVVISRWARWPAPLGISTNLADHRSLTGGGASSMLVVGDGDVLASRAGCLAYGTGAGIPGSPPTSVTAELGAAAGTVVGPTAGPPVLGYDWPADAVRRPATGGGDPGEGGVRRAVRTAPSWSPPARDGVQRRVSRTGTRAGLEWSIAGLGRATSRAAAASIAASPCPLTHSGSGPSSGMPTKNFAAMQPPWQAS